MLFADFKLVDVFDKITYIERNFIESIDLNYKFNWISRIYLISFRKYWRENNHHVQVSHYALSGA